MTGQARRLLLSLCIGLTYGLGDSANGAVELRHAPFVFWIDDLAAMDPRTEVRDYYADVNGARLHVREWGSVEAEPIFLLHGSSGHAHMWDRLGPSFGVEYRAISMSYRGYGNSSWTGPDTYSHEQFADDLYVLKEALGLEKIRVFGASMGGVVGAYFAARYPSDVSHLVFGDIGPSTPEAFEAAMKAGDARADPLQVDSWQEYMATTRRRVPNDEVHASFYGNYALLGADGKWTLRYDPSLFSPPGRLRRPPHTFWEKIDRITCETLIIRGESSNVLDREVAERMDRILPRNTFIEIEGVGHNFLSKFEDFRGDLSRFLRR